MSSAKTGCRRRKSEMSEDSKSVAKSASSDTSSEETRNLIAVREQEISLRGQELQARELELKYRTSELQYNAELATETLKVREKEDQRRQQAFLDSNKKRFWLKLFLPALAAIFIITVLLVLPPDSRPETIRFLLYFAGGLATGGAGGLYFGSRRR